VNAGVFRPFDAGGYTRFTRVTSGAWLVSDWRLKVTLLSVERSPYAAERVRPIGYAENGGGILPSNRPSAKIADIPHKRR